MKRATTRLTMALVLLLAGCGSSDESRYESNRCFSDDLGCGRTHCTSREICESVDCKVEEGYDNDFDYFYKSKCTETVDVTTIETPRDGNGIQTTTVRETVTKCFYKEKIDEDDFEVTDQCSVDSTETTVTREMCERDPGCPACEPICTPLDVTVNPNAEPSG